MDKIIIPTKPKMPLNNYLLDLLSKSDGKERSVYLNNVKEQIQEIWAELIKSNPRSLGVRKIIPERLGIHSGTIYGYKNGRKSISIQMLYQLLVIWKEKCNKTEAELKKIWDKIYNSKFYLSTHSRHQQICLPKFLNPKLSYLVGWICGDGHLSDYGNHFIIKISEKSTNQLKYVLRPLFKQVFNIDVPIFKIYKGGYAIQVGCKPVFRFLNQVLKIRVGEIPELINKLDKVNKRYFLAGIFDSEGYVCKDRYRATISQADLEFMQKLKELFNDLGVKFNGPTTHRTKLGTWYTIRLEKKSEIVKFVNLIGSYHIDKSKKLKEMILKMNL